MTALVGGEVEATFSNFVRWLAGQPLALAQPDQAAGEDGADLLEMGREVGAGGKRRCGIGHTHPLPTDVTKRLMMQFRFDSGSAQS